MNRSWVRFPQAALLSWVATPLTYGVASQGVLCEFSVGDVGSPCQGRGRARDQEYVACHEPVKRLEQRFTVSPRTRTSTLAKVSLPELVSGPIFRYSHAPKIHGRARAEEFVESSCPTTVGRH